MTSRLSRNFSRYKAKALSTIQLQLKMRHDLTLTQMVWGSRFSRAFFDLKIFNPHAKTSRKLHKDAYKYHKTLKNSKYQQRILNVEQSSFWPLIFECTGGAAPTATRKMQRLAEKLSEKRQESYPESINYIRTKINFALLRSSILGIRGCRSLRKVQFIDNSISAFVEEGRLR